MSTKREIRCINKSDRTNPHERIKNVGGIENGVRWKKTEDAAIRDIENGVYDYFVRQGVYEAKVIVAERLGKKYLNTVADGVSPDNLLSLPECPPL